jgi:molybdate transport system substrate-binding protein
MAEQSNDFIVMTSGAFTAAHLELIPRVESLIGRKVVTATTSVGTGETSIAARLKRGEIADIVIVADDLLRTFIADGLVMPDGVKQVARSSIGMAVRKGAPKPDLSSAEALKRVLLAAKSIGYSASVSGTYLTTELYQKLGIADECLPKSRHVGGGERVGAVVARGDLEIGFQQMSELLPVPGIDHITPLPPELQKVAIFSAGIGTNTRDAAAARKVIELLTSAEAAPAISRSGLEPLK